MTLAKENNEIMLFLKRFEWGRSEYGMSMFVNKIYIFGSVGLFDSQNSSTPIRIS